ncbi:hypothetical protein ABZP36_008477 [Zizania latifolia]
MMEDHSVCSLHPGVAVTGFCPACLRDRLAGLHPPSADLRRCKSFSYYGRSSSTAAAAAAYMEPHRRSCDSRQPPPVPEEIGRPIKEHMSQESSTRAAGAFGTLGKRWQEWRRKSKLKKQGPTCRPAVPVPPEPELAIDALGRRSCDAYTAFSGRINQLLRVEEPRASWDGYSGGRPGLGPLPSMLQFVPRSDGQIHVEEEDEDAVPGGTAQTRDYYLDSSSSSRRRRSLDRKSFSDASEMPRMAAGAAANARVSPAVVVAEFYHYQQQQQQHAAQLSVLDHHHQPSFEPALQEAKSKTKKGIKGWSIWGLLQKKSSSSSSVAGTACAFGEPRPELRARGYDGQMLRCNSSVSARSSFSGTTGRSVNGGGLVRMRRDEVFSARYSPCSGSRSSLGLY